MTYQEALATEIKSLPQTLLPEVLDFVLFLKIKATTPDNHLSNKIRDLRFQQELQALSQAYRIRLSQDGKLEENAEEVMAALKQKREEIAAHEYRQ